MESTQHTEESHVTFNLPDEDNDVKALGYKTGLRVLYSMLPDKDKQVGTDLSGGFVTTFPAPSETATVDSMAHMLANNLLGETYHTNDAERYVRLFVDGFTRGYKFADYAACHGLLNIYNEVSNDASHAAAYIFALQLYGVAVPDGDLTPDRVKVIDKIGAIYKQYQALN